MAINPQEKAQTMDQLKDAMEVLKQKLRNTTGAAHEKVKSEVQVILKKMCILDREPVKGKFHFYEVRGGKLEFSYKAYEWDEAIKYSLTDGEVTTIPIGVAKHLNKNGWYPIHTHTFDIEGKPSQEVGKRVRRFGFENTSFIDMSDRDAVQTMGPSPIQEVTVTPQGG